MASDIFPDVRVMQDVSNLVTGNTGIGFKTNLAQAMVSAAESTLRTASISTTSAPAGDVLNTLASLNTLGYNATISGSTLTVTW